jgi:hypothetical protein
MSTKRKRASARGKGHKKEPEKESTPPPSSQPDSVDCKQEEAANKRPKVTQEPVVSDSVDSRAIGYKIAMELLQAHQEEDGIIS